MSTVAKRLSVAQYEAMIENGILPESNRWELINGKLVEKMTKGGKHSASSERSWRAIHALLPAGWHVRIEKPVRIPRRRSEPEPDVSVARGSVDDYEGHPGPSDVALVVEVAESSVAKDRRLARVYGGGGIPVYWLVNIPDRQLEVYTGGACTILGATESVGVVIDGQVVGTIAVASLLPRSRGGA
ncbi:MAG TPA: Uma2 family endonuclease [Isosphaeraceae bacterium]|nr:Uma2 family endonuclease [Isosphaeraceae bacterium]